MQDISLQNSKTHTWMHITHEIMLCMNSIYSVFLINLFCCFFPSFFRSFCVVFLFSLLHLFISPPFLPFLSSLHLLCIFFFHVQILYTRFFLLFFFFFFLLLLLFCFCFLFSPSFSGFFNFLYFLLFYFF